MTMTPENGPHRQETGDAETDARLRQLRQRIAEQRARREEAAQRNGRDPRAAAHHLVLRLLADMGVALAAGLVLGWAIDHYFGSRPWGLLFGMLLGIAAGVRNVMHTADSASRSTKRPGVTRKDNDPAAG